jgi:hypothetical protein
MLSWPAAQLFPALDLARLLVLDASAAQRLVSTAGSVSPTSPAGSLGKAVHEAAAPQALPANLQTAARLAANCLLHAPSQQWVFINIAKLLDAFEPCTLSPNKAVRQSLATLLLNVAVTLPKAMPAGSNAAAEITAKVCWVPMRWAGTSAHTVSKSH